MAPAPNPAVRQSEDSGRSARLSGRVAFREDIGDSHRSGHSRRRGRPSPRQSALLARSGKRASHRERYRDQNQRNTDFERRLKQADQQWLAEMKPYAGRKIVTYHRSWPNFADHFHLDVAGYVEPRPGIPPSPQHTVELIQLMKRDGVKVIVVEPYFDLKTPNSIARETGGQVLVLMPSVGGEKEITDYFKLFDYNIAKLKQAFDTTK